MGFHCADRYRRCLTAGLRKRQVRPASFPAHPGVAVARALPWRTTSNRHAKRYFGRLCIGACLVSHAVLTWPHPAQCQTAPSLRISPLHVVLIVTFPRNLSTFSGQCKSHQLALSNSLSEQIETRVVLDQNAQLHSQAPQPCVREGVHVALAHFDYVAGPHSSAVRPSLDLYYFPLVPLPLGALAAGAAASAWGTVMYEAMVASVLLKSSIAVEMMLSRLACRAFSATIKEIPVHRCTR